MQKLSTKLGLILGLASLLASCRANSPASDLQWGHFKSLDQGIDARPFLFGISPQETLHVCISSPLPSSIQKSWLQAEIFSALNLWAMQIGRSIPVDFSSCQLKPRLRILFADVPVLDDFIGYTKFEEGERQIYLDSHSDWEDTGTTLGFAKLAEFNNNNWQEKAKFLLPILIEGNYSPIKLGSSSIGGRFRQPTFGTLLHEFGHAFGLCDLYQDDNSELGFHSNCSKTHRSQQLSPLEIMSASTRPGTARFALSTGDKEGLRALASRSNFPNLGWPAATLNMSVADVLAQLNSSSETTEELKNFPGISLSPPQGRLSVDNTGKLRFELEVEANLEITAISLFETKGRSPFFQLQEDASQVRSGKRYWSIPLSLASGTYIFHAVDSKHAGNKDGFVELSLRIF